MTTPDSGTRVALITGAARGIGAAVADDLSERGWRLALVDICAPEPSLTYPLATRAELDAVAERCGRDTIVGAVDVRDREGLRDFVDSVIAEHGRLDAAISAAGAIAGGPRAWETTYDTWQTMLDINLTGVFHLVETAVPHLLRSEQGRFVAIASAAGSVGLPQLSAYTAAKHGVIGLIRALAAEVGPVGATANVVSPGSTNTDMLDATATIYDVASGQDFAQHSRLSRLLHPGEVAAAVAWLCTPEAGGVNGSVIAVDGGFSG